MLAVVPTTPGRDGRDCDECSFPDDNNLLLESIDFDDLFVGMDDMLPDLEMDSELQFTSCLTDDQFNKKTEEQVTSTNNQPTITHKPQTNKSNNSSSQSQGNKRKVKVDWTPELHRRFVQAVEQLGVDKAVPSRILEIMGIGCLTRHNIASHLQKYRSHRKHLLAREAEAASWSQRRQMMYGGNKGGSGVISSKRPIAASMGFPSMTQVVYRPPPAPAPLPLHVWGHPSMDRRPPLMPPAPLYMPPSNHNIIAHSPPVWPPSTSPPPAWHQRQAPYFPQILPQTTRFPIPVPGIPPPHAAAMYKMDSPPSTSPQPPLDIHPSKESIDAAIGDILSKPWQPLPLGLKPPALDSVMLELHKQGIQKIPPTCV